MGEIERDIPVIAESPKFSMFSNETILGCYTHRVQNVVMRLTRKVQRSSFLGVQVYMQQHFTCDYDNR